MTIEEFIEKCQKRPLPSNLMARVKLLARELAEGASNKLWSIRIDINSQEWHSKILPFLRSRVEGFDYNTEFPLFYVSEFLTPNDTSGLRISELTKSAFALLNEAPPAFIFISYKRSESSAFANGGQVNSFGIISFPRP
jgi:hypothetical protein